MVKQCCFKLSNAWKVLCIIVQWSDSVVSFCPTVQWLDSAVSSSPSIVLQYDFNLCNGKMVWKDNNIALNCLGGCITFFLQFSKLLYNFLYFVEQFVIQNFILSDSVNFSAPLNIIPHFSSN